MKVFRVYFLDRWDTFGYEDFTNREAAEQYVQWHNTHPTPGSDMGWYDISEVDVHPVHDTFVPMSEDEYSTKYADFLAKRKAEEAIEAEMEAMYELDGDPYDDPLM